jgi:hypothetical protein
MRAWTGFRELKRETIFIQGGSNKEWPMSKNRKEIEIFIIISRITLKQNNNNNINFNFNLLYLGFVNSDLQNLNY